MDRVPFTSLPAKNVLLSSIVESALRNPVPAGPLPDGVYEVYPADAAPARAHGDAAAVVRCMEVQLTSEAESLVVWRRPCASSAPRQQWRLVSSLSGGGSYTLAPCAAPGCRLDKAYGGPGKGFVIVYAAHPGPNQRWRLLPAAGATGLFELAPECDGSVRLEYDADAADAQEDGEEVEVESAGVKPSTGASCQRFVLVRCSPAPPTSGGAGGAAGGGAGGVSG